MLAALLLASACAGPAPIALPQNGYGRLVQGVEYLAQSDPSQGLELVSGEPACTQFQPAKHTVNLSSTYVGVWQRLRIDWHESDPAQWRLSVPFPGLDRVCVHWPLADGHVQAQCHPAGAYERAASFDGSGYLFEPPIDLDRGGAIHVLAQSGLWLKVPLAIGTVPGLLRHDHIVQLGWGVYYGVLLAMVLMSVLTFLSRGGRPFFHFALHLLALALALALWQGRLAPWDPPGWSLTRLAPSCAALFLAAGARFYQRFLHTRGNLPKAHRLLGAVTFASLALALLLPFAPIPLMPVLGALGLAWLAVSAGTALLRMRQGFRPAVPVLASTAMLFVAVLFNALESFGVQLVNPDLSLTLASVGAVIAAMFLAVGLVLRVRQLVDQRDQAARVSLASQQLALHRSRFDELTGLSSRSKFCDDLRDRLPSAARDRAQLGIALIGLDRFREVNQALGHEGGDAVLQEIAQRLRQLAGSGDLLARLGADVYAWVFPLRADGARQDLDARCAAMRAALASPLGRAGGATVSASVGLALYPEHADTQEGLLRHAEAALHLAKERGGNQVELFAPQLEQVAQRNFELNRELRLALEQGALQLHYQPIVTLDRSEVAGVEALLRWPGAPFVVSPEQLVAVAETSELLGPFTDWALQTACRQLMQWRSRGLALPRVAVNISARQFRLEGFERRVAEAQHLAGLPAGVLSLEITETLLLDDLAVARGLLQRLRASGVSVAVDDFGVRYSSLNYLRSLPLDSIKIDRSFITGVPGEVEAVSVIAAIVTIGRQLGLRVVAEGIERREQSEFLQRHGVNYGQGFWFAPVLPPDELEAWLAGRTLLGPEPLRGL